MNFDKYRSWPTKFESIIFGIYCGYRLPPSAIREDGKILWSHSTSTVNFAIHKCQSMKTEMCSYKFYSLQNKIWKSKAYVGKYIVLLANICVMCGACSLETVKTWIYLHKIKSQVTCGRKKGIFRWHFLSPFDVFVIAEHLWQISCRKKSYVIFFKAGKDFVIYDEKLLGNLFCAILQRTFQKWIQKGSKK